MTDLDTIPAPEIARRLRVARENANKSQEEAADVIGLSQSDMFAIENGERSVQIRDVQKLARFYGLSLNALMRHEAIHVNLIPKFRRLKNSHSADVIEAAKELNVLVSAEVELENILGLSRISEYPAERNISAGNLEELGEQHARELRKRLGIGAGPATNIFSLIELQLGIRLYQRKLDMGISGLFVYDDRVGACILLNADHSLESRVYSAAHEVGHFIGTRHSPESYNQSGEYSSRDEQYADAFAQSFLAPSDTFSEAFYRIIAGSDRISRRCVVLLSHQFGVSREFCVRRMEKIGLANKGTWDWFEANGGISNKHVKEVLGSHINEPDPYRIDSNRPVPYRIGLMAYQVRECELLSEGQLSELLRMNRVDLRHFLNTLTLEEGASNEIFRLPSRY